MNFEEKI